MDCTRSSLALMEKLMKLVSTRMWYGGPSCVLYWKNRQDGCWGLRGRQGIASVSCERGDELLQPVVGEGRHLHLPLLDGARVLLLLLGGGFRPLLLVAATKRGHRWGTGQRRGPSSTGTVPIPMSIPISPSPSGHSHALVPQADHALHHRVLPRLLLLPLQRDAAAVSRARPPGVPPVPSPRVPPHHAATTTSTTSTSSGASTQRHRVPPRRAGPAPPSLPGEAEPGAAAAEPEPSVTSAGRGLRHRGAARSGAGAVRLVPGGGHRGVGAPQRVSPCSPARPRVAEGSPRSPAALSRASEPQGAKPLRGGLVPGL